MHSPTRSTHVLVYGVGESRFKRYAREFRTELTRRAPWDVFITAAETPNLAEASIEASEELDLVYFPLELAQRQEAFNVLMHDLRMIAETMADHPNKPWAVVHRGINELKDYFKMLGVHATDSLLEVAASNRWNKITSKRLLLLTR